MVAIQSLFLRPPKRWQPLPEGGRLQEIRRVSRTKTNRSANRIWYEKKKKNVRSMPKTRRLDYRTSSDGSRTIDLHQGTGRSQTTWFVSSNRTGFVRKPIDPVVTQVWCNCTWAWVWFEVHRPVPIW